jgi:hypothetical protein
MNRKGASHDDDSRIRPFRIVASNELFDPALAGFQWWPKIAKPK